MRHSDSWAQAQPLRQFFDHLSDAVLLLDRQARLAFANTAALRALSCELGVGATQWRTLLGEGTVEWIHRCVASTTAGKTSVRMTVEASRSVDLPDGRRAQLVWQPLDELHSALRLQFTPAAAPTVAPPGRPP